MKNIFVTLLLCLTPLLGKAQKQMGVQLYSVRTLIGSAEQFAQNGKQVLSELAGMGYTAAEPANYADGKFYGLSPLEFKKRVFKRAPLHHHFEQKGIHENKIVLVYIIIIFN